jgi:hypothetical protein
VSGSDDQLWPASRMCQMILERVRAHGREDVRHLEYADAGHALVPYDPGDIPQRGLRIDVGGSPEAARAAHEQAWPIVLGHLRSAVNS